METVHRFISKRLSEIENRQEDAYKDTLLLSFLKKAKKIVDNNNRNKDETLDKLKELEEEINQSVNSLKIKIDNYNEDPMSYVNHSIDEVSYWFDKWNLESEKLNLLSQLIVRVVKDDDYE